MSARQIRDFYGVWPRVRQRVRVDGRLGVITAIRDQYIYVRFDGEKRSRLCHPTWRVDYL